MVDVLDHGAVRVPGARSDAAHWWDCRTVASFRPMAVEVAGAVPERLLFSLLRPVGDGGVLILTQTPQPAG
ncbi:hypothetical protein [Nonomuraea longicatena]|uniref:Uncharacterized protein n=1 Tax=Nonomuraea longicatena TaxID=83682 RepID=A0ABN1PDW5_9ACTN